MAACHCKGRSGKRKRIFRTAQQAEAAGKRDFSQPIFDVYPCPTKKNRYHLSHVLEYPHKHDNDSSEAIAFWESADRLGRTGNGWEHSNEEHGESPEGQ